MASHKQDLITQLQCTTNTATNPPIQAESWAPGSSGIDPWFEIDCVIPLPLGSITGGQIDWDGDIGTAQVFLTAAEFVAAADGGTLLQFVSPGVGGEAGQKWTNMRLSFYGATGAGAPPDVFVVELYGDPPGGGS